MPSASETPLHLGLRQRRRPVKQQATLDNSGQESLDEVHGSQTTERAITTCDAQPFAPSHIYWITPHSFLSQQISILDLSHDVNDPGGDLNDTFKTDLQKALKDHAHAPAMTCLRRTWLGLSWDVVDEQQKHLAHWKHPWSSVGEAVLTFPADSSLSCHPVTLRNRRWGLRTEAFTINSQPYIWEMGSIWHSTSMTLYKVFGAARNESKIVVARFAQKTFGVFVTGGSLLVDEREIHPLVACLSICVVLKKKRQRAVERRQAAG